MSIISILASYASPTPASYASPTPASSAPTAIIFLFLLIGLVLAINAYLLIATSEFSVTTKRLVMKSGLIRRKCTEIVLSKVEAINIDQSILGRIFNYGTIIVCGSGGTKEGFKRIANPFKFRTMYQKAVELSHN